MMARPSFVAEQRVNDVPQCLFETALSTLGVCHHVGVYQGHGILKSNNMARAFFSQFSHFFHAKRHFKIKEIECPPTR